MSTSKKILNLDLLSSIQTNTSFLVGNNQNNSGLFLLKYRILKNYIINKLEKSVIDDILRINNINNDVNTLSVQCDSLLKLTTMLRGDILTLMQEIETYNVPELVLLIHDCTSNTEILNSNINSLSTDISTVKSQTSSILDNVGELIFSSQLDDYANTSKLVEELYKELLYYSYYDFVNLSSKLYGGISVTVTPEFLHEIYEDGTSSIISNFSYESCEYESLSVPIILNLSNDLNVLEFTTLKNYVEVENNVNNITDLSSTFDQYYDNLENYIQYKLLSGNSIELITTNKLKPIIRLSDPDTSISVQQYSFDNANDPKILTSLTLSITLSNIYVFNNISTINGTVPKNVDAIINNSEYIYLPLSVINDILTITDYDISANNYPNNLLTKITPLNTEICINSIKYRHLVPDEADSIPSATEGDANILSYNTKYSSTETNNVNSNTKLQLTIDTDNNTYIYNGDINIPTLLKLKFNEHPYSVELTLIANTDDDILTCFTLYIPQITANNSENTTNDILSTIIMTYTDIKTKIENKLLSTKTSYNWVINTSLLTSDGLDDSDPQLTSSSSSIYDIFSVSPENISDILYSTFQDVDKLSVIDNITLLLLHNIVYYTKTIPEFNFTETIK